MLELNADCLKKAGGAWSAAGVILPQFDCGEMSAYTKRNPIWLHFGAGNIFRGFIARLSQKLLNKGLVKSGIIAADTFDYDIIRKIYVPFDNLTLMVDLKADGSMGYEVIGSVAEALCADSSSAEQMARLTDIAADPGLQMISFTITEKGYTLKNMAGEYLPVVLEDMGAGPGKPRHAMSIAACLLYRRFLENAAPIALVSMDNCSHNGEKLKSSVMEIAKAWNRNGFVGADFLAYLDNEEKIAFPWTMIDKITPRPATAVEERLRGLGIAGMGSVVTERNTFIAPFVNAEVPQYLVVEDRFPNGRPALEEAGVYMTSRDTVNKTERMKVTTCLNPLHTALAVYGCLLGYTSIAEEMKDRHLKNLVCGIGYREGMPVVTHPGILNPTDFIREVIEERLPNPFIPDTPQRIATDTSLKIPIRFGETIKAYLANPELDVRALTCIPLAIAGWLRYLLGVDDRGVKMDLSPDPMLDKLQEGLRGIEVGKPESCKGRLGGILSNTSLFAVDLCEAGLEDKIEKMFCELIAGPGAVRATLGKYCGQTGKMPVM